MAAPGPRAGAGVLGRKGRHRRAGLRPKARRVAAQRPLRDGSPAPAHYPQIEQPDEVADAIDRFAAAEKPSLQRNPTKAIHVGRGYGPSPETTLQGVKENDMMQVWHFSEMAYHPAWPQLGDSYRVTIP